MSLMDRMCLQGQDSGIAVSPSPPPTPPRASDPNRRHHLLQYTSTIGREEFEARCRQQDFWYHSYYFDNGFAQRGDYDIGLDIGDYRFPDDMKGMSVLDIGTGGGWFATYFDQRGADVTTVDARGYCDFDVFGRDRNPDVSTEKAVPDRVLPDGRPIYDSPVSGAFWIMKEILGLKAEFYNERLYDVAPALFGGRKFDLVFMGAVLMHLRDPIGALMAAHTVCAGQFISNMFTTDSDPRSDAPMMFMRKGAGHGFDWWTPNIACLDEWVRAAGFSRVELPGVVHLTADSPYADRHGISSAVDQTLQVIHAFV